MNTHHSGSNVLKELDSRIDLTGHILLRFYIRDLNYQDSQFHSIAHLMCHRHAVFAGQKTFSTDIWKWSKPLMDFPTPKFKTIYWQRQWRSVLMDIYSHLCQRMCQLRQCGPRPFTLHCCTPWGDMPNEADTGSRANIVSDILVDKRVHATAGRLTPCTWLAPGYSRSGLRNATRSLVPALLERV